MSKPINDIKQRLRSYRDKLTKDLKNQQLRLDRTEMRLTSIGSPSLSDMPRSSSGPFDRTSYLVAQKVDLESEVVSLQNELIEEWKDIELIIKKLKNSEEKAVIRMRYHDGMDWNDVADTMFGDKDDYLDKVDTYQRRVFRLHGQALVNMSAIENKKENL